MLDVFPMVPLGKNLTFNVAIVSYNGRMDFGLIDFDTMPDLDEVAADFAAALDEVRAEAGVGEQTTAPVPSGSREPTAADEIHEALDSETGHVDTPVELVAEQADPGAEEGAGPEIHVEEPWPGYDRMTTPELIARLHEASDEVAAVVDLYERMHRDRRPVREAAERALSRPGSTASRCEAWPRPRAARARSNSPSRRSGSSRRSARSTGRRASARSRPRTCRPSTA